MNALFQHRIRAKLMILDWGIGGLGAYRYVREKRPDIDILYLSDSGQTPYGKMAKKDLGDRIQALLHAAKRENITHAIVACNAASTVLPDFESPISTTGVIEKPIEILVNEGTILRPRLGIIGGQRTIDSGAWTRPLEDAGFDVHARVAQPLSAIIEAGTFRDHDTLEVFEEILRPLEDVTDLILACTHYIAARERILKILPSVKLFDPVVYSVEAFLEKTTIPEGSGRTIFRTTGDFSEMQRAAKHAFEVEIPASFG